MTSRQLAGWFWRCLMIGAAAAAAFFLVADGIGLPWWTAAIFTLIMAYLFSAGSEIAAYRIFRRQKER